MHLNLSTAVFLFACSALPAMADETASLQIAPVDYLEDFSISLGAGITYSRMGGNINYRPIRQIELFYGQGNYFSRNGESYGFRAYPSESYQSLYLGLSHNPNTDGRSSIAWGNNDSDLRASYSGYNASIGLAPQHGKSGFECDLNFILTREHYAEDLKIARQNGYTEGRDKDKVRISLGYRWNL